MVSICPKRTMLLLMRALVHCYFGKLCGIIHLVLEEESKVEQWLIAAEIRNDGNGFGRSLSDLQSLDKHGRIRIEDGVYILGFGRHRGTDIITVLKQDPKVNGYYHLKALKMKGRNVLSEFISSIRDR